MKDFDLKKYLAEGRLFEEDMTSKAVSVLKSYKGEVKGLEDYIKYLMNTNDDISSSIQAVADDMDRDNDAEDSLRRDLEKLSLAEGKLIKEYMDLKIDGDYIELSSYSGEYSGNLNNDGTVDFSVYYDDGTEFDEDNWKDILGPKHAFVKISNQIPTKVEAVDDYVMITVDLEDLEAISEIKPKSDDSLDSPAAGNIEATYSKPGGPVFKSYSDFQDYYK
jgi:hypothetical protein